MNRKCSYSKRHIRRLIHNECLSLKRGVHTKLPQQLNNPNNSTNYDQCNIETYDELSNAQSINETDNELVQYTSECKLVKLFIYTNYFHNKNY